MRPTGGLHLGHWSGVLRNWLALQEKADCFFFVADWHALTTDYGHPQGIAAASREMVVTWLAAGVDPEKTTLFIQSHIPQHAELHVLLSMICPLSKLEQLPTYKEQKENTENDLDTYGFLGYPLLQSADILAYRAHSVPVGKDQVPHIEFTREVARRFNTLYGRTEKYKAAVRQILNDKTDIASVLKKNVRKYRESGDPQALQSGLEAVQRSSMSAADKRLLRGHCLYDADELLPAPDALLTPESRLPGTDGRKMSKSYHNTIELFDEPPIIEKKLLRMQTDPARQRLQDKGNPEVCPVWSLHREFSSEATQQWANEGCRNAAFGCVECKKALSQHLVAELEPLANKRRDLEKDDRVDDILKEGGERARTEAEITINLVREAMGLVAQ